MGNNASLDADAIQTAFEHGRDISIAQAIPKKAPGVLDAAPYIVLRDGDGNDYVKVLGEKEHQLPPPHRKTGTVKLFDADSFIAYYAMHGNGAPVYATMSPAQFVAVLNDHTKDKADWRDHRALFTIGYSKEWFAWTKHNGQGAAFGSNDAFAVFLEDNAPDIVKPDPSTMLNIALNFRINESVAFANIVRLQDGNTELLYNSLVDASSKNDKGGKVKLPEQFSIEIPVWEGLTAKKYKLDARFRFRLREGKLTIWYELVRPHKVVEQAFKDVWDQISKATKAPVLHGTPE